jgi:hypothetical protein
MNKKEGQMSSKKMDYTETASKEGRFSILKRIKKSMDSVGQPRRTRWKTKK